MRLLDRINRTGTTVMMATHDHAIVDAMRRRVVQLERGRVVRDQAGRDTNPRPTWWTSSGGRPRDMSTVLYLIGEAFTNLRRNILVVTGAVLAVFVSLTLAFGALVFNELVRVNTLQWQEGEHIIIFLKDEGGPAAHRALLEEIQGFEEVRRAWYLDKAGAYREFQEMFSNQPALVETMTAAELPASIRVELDDISSYQEVQFRLVGHQLLRRLSVFSEGIERLLSLTQVLNSIGIGLVAVLGAAAVVLIANTIRMAIYARGRR